MKNMSEKMLGWEIVPQHEIYEKKVKEKSYTVSPNSDVFMKMIDPILGRDDLRPILTGVFFDAKNKRACGTDAHQLITFPYEGDYQGVIKKDGKEEEGKYPDYDLVIPQKNTYEFKVNVRKLKMYCETLIRVGLVNKTVYQASFFYPSNEKGYKDVIGLNVRFVINACTLLLECGLEEVYMGVTASNKAITYSEYPMIERKGIYGLLMPVMLLESANLAKQPIHSFYDEFDHKKEYRFGFDLETSTVLGENWKQIDLKLQPKPKGVMQGGIDVSLVKKLKTVFKLGNHTLPILDLVKISNKTLTVSNLRAFLEIKNVNMPDGMYQIKGESLFLSDSHVIEDYPSAPVLSKNNLKKCSINLEEFNYYVERASNYVGNDDLRPIMNAVALNDDYVTEGIEMVSTDAHTLFRQKLDLVKKDKQIGTILILYPKVISGLTNYLDCDYIECVADNDNTVLECEDFKFTMRSEDGKYPNYDAVWGFKNTDRVLKLPNKVWREIQKELDNFFKAEKSKRADLYPVVGISKNKIVAYDTSGYGATLKYEELKSFDIEGAEIIHADINEDSNIYELLQMPMLKYYGDCLFAVNYKLAKRLFSTSKNDIINIRYVEAESKNKGFFVDGFDEWKQSVKNAKKKKAAPKKPDQKDEINDAIDSLLLVVDVLEGKEKQQYEDAILSLKLLRDAL